MEYHSDYIITNEVALPVVFAALLLRAGLYSVLVLIPQIDIVTVAHIPLTIAHVKLKLVSSLSIRKVFRN